MINIPTNFGETLSIR